MNLFSNSLSSALLPLILSTLHFEPFIWCGRVWKTSNSLELLQTKKAWELMFVSIKPFHLETGRKMTLDSVCLWFNEFYQSSNRTVASVGNLWTFGKFGTKFLFVI